MSGNLESGFLLTKVRGLFAHAEIRTLGTQSAASRKVGTRCSKSISQLYRPRLYVQYPASPARVDGHGTPAGYLVLFAVDVHGVSAERTSMARRRPACPSPLILVPLRIRQRTCRLLRTLIVRGRPSASDRLSPTIPGGLSASWPSFLSSRFLALAS